jgi:hypothetical protein
MIDNSSAWIARADVLLNHQYRNAPQVAAEAAQFATSMLTALYGSESPQLKAFRASCDAVSKGKEGAGGKAFELSALSLGTISNAKAELEAGLIAKLRVLVAGEILAELVRLGKEILEEKTDAAKNVAAVMIAAAFEDLLRRMGVELATVEGRPNLQDVLNVLKDAGVLKGGEIGTAQSFLKFRNDSLHADWANVSRAQVESCTGFIDAMLVKHFS